MSFWKTRIFPLPARADSAHRQVGRGAAFEFQANVGDVFFVGENRDADGVHGNEGGLNDLEDDVDVVDHEVEDDSDVGNARIERSEAVAFNECGAVEHSAQVADGGVVAFDVADLEDAVVALSHVDEVFGVFDGGGNGFFDHAVDAAREELGGDFVVEGGGDGDADRVDHVEDFSDAFVPLCAPLGGDFFGPFAAAVDNGDQFTLGVFGKDSGVVLAEVAYADYCNS